MPTSREPGPAAVDPRRTILAMALGLWSLVGCLHATAAVPPANGLQAIGADHANAAIGFWTCPDATIVLSRDNGQLWLHGLDSDWIVGNPTERPDHKSNQFYVDLGAGNQLVYDIPLDPAGVAKQFMTTNVMTGFMQVQSSTQSSVATVSQQSETGWIPCTPGPAWRFL